MLGACYCAGALLGQGQSCTGWNAAARGKRKGEIDCIWQFYCKAMQGVCRCTWDQAWGWQGLGRQTCARKVRNQLTACGADSVVFELVAIMDL